MSDLKEGVDQVAATIAATKPKQPKTAELAERFKTIVTKDKVVVTDGVPTLPVEVFKECQEIAGIDDATLIRCRRFVSSFGAAAHEATGLVAVDLLKADSALEKVKTCINMGELRSANGVVRRQHTGTKPGTKESVTTLGSNRFSLAMISGGDVAPLNAATAAIKEYATKMLGA